MQRGMRLAAAGAITLALGGVVGASGSDGEADAAQGHHGARRERAPRRPAPAVPTFVNGMAQNVFAAAPADWVNRRGVGRVELRHRWRRQQDRMHADFSLPRETTTDGLKVPVIYEDSPYYAGTAPTSRNWAVDHELGAPPAARSAAPFFNARQHEPERSPRLTRPRGCRAASRVVHSESPGSGYSDGCPNSGAPTRRSARPR